MRFTCLLGIIWLGFWTGEVPAQAGAAVQKNRPNVVLIMADDLAYSDLGCYGGEIDTPRLDALAANGLQFTNYRTSPMCVTTRASLLAGREYHMAGKQKMDRAVPLARAMRDGGYRTIIAGKWHLAGHPLDDHMGFERFFGFLGGQTNCFVGGPDWRIGRERFAAFDDDFYATDNFTDYALREINQAKKDGKPYFLFLSYNAPHVPLQAPEAEVRKYLDRGVYDAGWMPVREQRIERLKQLGLIDRTFPNTAPGSDVKPWDLLGTKTQQHEVMKQAAYAGMIDRIDQNVGRLIDEIKRRGELDDTLIIFVSDNGGDFVGIRTEHDALPWNRSERGGLRLYTGSNGWAYANNAPFRSYKHSGHEGGLSSPFIVHWPAGVSLNPGTVLRQNVRVWDLYPTILEAAGVALAQDAPKPMGESLTAMFNDADAPGYDDFISSFIYTRAIVSDGWKATSFSTRPWELYDLNTDRAEANDLAKKKPEKLAQLLRRWDAFVEEAGNVDASWNPEVGEVVYWMDQRRIPGLVSVVPKMSQPDASVDAKLTLTFTGPIVFKDEKGVGMTGRIRLMRYGQEREVWSVDPTPDHLVDARTLRLHDMPTLEPGVRYYVLLDAGALRYQAAEGVVHPVHPIHDEAYAWRFTTTQGEAENP